MDKIRPYIDGWIAGSIAMFITHPLDTIKTRIQDQKDIKYDIRSLYKGIGPPLIGAGLSRAALFGTYSYVKSNIDNSFNYEIAGMIAGVCNAIVANPFQRLKIVKQTSDSIIKINSLYRGLQISMLRDSVAFIVYFSFYERTKQYINPANINYINGLIGGAAGAITWLFIYPIDTIKTRIQADNNQAIGNLRFMYKGFSYALMRAVPLHGITFYMLEWLKKYN